MKRFLCCSLTPTSDIKSWLRVKFVCSTVNRRQSSSGTSSVKRQRSKVEVDEDTVKVDRDRIIQEEISATGKVFMSALFQTSETLYFLLLQNY